MILKPFEDVVDLGLLLLQGGQLGNDADRQAVRVGVQEGSAVHVPLEPSDELVGQAFVSCQIEPLFDSAPGQLNDLLDAQVHVRGVEFSPQTGLLGQDRVHSVSGDDDVGPQIALVTPNAYARDSSILV